jgi:hypothetical protein
VNVSEHLRANALKSGAFNHYRPARYLAENIGKLQGGLDDATLNRFEAAFKVLNSLL